MKGISYRVASIAIVLFVLMKSTEPVVVEVEDAKTVDEKIAELNSQIANFKDLVKHLGRQVMAQSFNLEEKIRSDGDSGLKIIRLSREGTDSYHSSTHNNPRIASIHDHSNVYNTIGMGDLLVVLNGVEFRTRHNDYKLRKPETVEEGGDKIEYNKLVDIEYPDVPDTVNGTVDQQIAEMQEYFKAFNDQNPEHRDYTKYFKPVLCYLEGGWTSADPDTLDEPFDSARHFINAKSFHDLLDKVRFTAHTGRKDRLENFSVLPATIVNMHDDGVPVIGQWNYRIACHPLENDLPTKYLKPVDDPTSRLANNMNFDEYVQSRNARFQISTSEKPGYTKYSLLDELMGGIPGKNGYGSVLTDDGISGDPKERAKNYKDPSQELNAAYYHRIFKTLRKDANGDQTNRRGFHDKNIFMAKSTQDNDSKFKVNYCKNEKRQRGCHKDEQSWTYAIPLEIIYLTPLQKWNPYNIEFRNTNEYPYDWKNGVTGRTAESALPFASRRSYRLTPRGFFKSHKRSSDKADTANGSPWTKGGDGNAYQVTASGVFIQLPTIGDMAQRIRLRYPIVPIHQDGSSAVKKVDALKDAIFDQANHDEAGYNTDDEDMMTKMEL